MASATTSAASSSSKPQIALFLEYIKQHHKEYYERCESSASNLLTAFYVDSHSADGVSFNESQALDEARLNTILDGILKAPSDDEAEVAVAFECGRVRSESARKVFTSLQAAKEETRAFFGEQSIFSVLRDSIYTPKEGKDYELHDWTVATMNRIAPSAPTIDDTFGLTTTTLKITLPFKQALKTMGDTMNREVQTHTILAVADGSKDAATAVPLFVRNPKMARDDRCIRATTAYKLEPENMVAENDPLRLVQTRTTDDGKYYAITWLHNGLYVPRMKLEVLSKEEVQNCDRWDRIMYIGINESGAYPIKCTDVYHSDERVAATKSHPVFKRLAAHNLIWKSYRDAEIEWENFELYRGDPGNAPIDWVKLQLIADIVLLDASRFGWAPCMSTPEQAPPTNEDGVARTFRTDLAEFATSKKMDIKSPFSQQSRQWMCTDFMHSDDFLKLRRRRLVKQILGVDKLSTKGQINKWVNTPLSPEDRNERHADFVSAVNAYSIAPNNDIAALCLCFTMTRIRLREGMLRPFRASQAEEVQNALRRIRSVLSSPRYQSVSTIRQMKFLAYRAISVPAHETLKRPALGWTRECIEIGYMIADGGDLTSKRVLEVSESRKKLADAFIVHADDKRREFRKSSVTQADVEARSDSVVVSGLPASVAMHCFDHPRLCMRGRIRLPTAMQRKTVLELLSSAEKDAQEKDGDEFDVVNIFKAHQRALREKTELELNDYYKTVATQKNIEWVVRNYGDKILTTRGGGTSAQRREEFTRIYRKWARKERLEPNRARSFLCDVALNYILHKASIVGPDLGSDLSRRIRAAPRRQAPDDASIGTMKPLVFEDPKVDTDIVIVAEIDVSLLRTSSDASVTLADVELDTLLAYLKIMAPPFKVPSEAVQDAFQKVADTKDLRVVRMDWWMGYAVDGQVNTYQDAMKIVPVVPYRFSAPQLRRYDASISAPATGGVLNTAQKTPFDDAERVATSIQNVTNDLRDSLGDQFSPEMRRVLINASVVTDTFNDERRVEVQAYESLGRVCRVAFELLQGNDFNPTPPAVGQPLQPLTYADVAVRYGLREGTFYGREKPDQLILEYVNIPSDMGSKRAMGKFVSYHLNALLVPYQHSVHSAANDPRSFQIAQYHEGIRHAMLFPEKAIAILRWLQWRISTSAYAIDSLRRVYQSDLRIKNHRFNLELASQEAARYSLVAPYGEGDRISNTTRVLAKFLFPSEFKTGRMTSDIRNLEFKKTIADTKVGQHQYDACLYMSTAIESLKAIANDVPPASLHSGAASERTVERFAELKAILGEMARIADGIEQARPLLSYLKKASKILTRLRPRYATKYRASVEVTAVLQASANAILNDFESNHAKLEDAVRSYADMSSSGTLSLASFKDRFLKAYGSVRSFRKRYDQGVRGLLAYLANELQQSLTGQASQKTTRPLATALFTAIELMMTSERFVRNVPTLDAQLDLSATLRAMLPDMNTFTTYAARMHVNATVGCVTSAACFRDVPDIIRNHPDRAYYTPMIRQSRGFDTLNGYLDEGRTLAKFHCFLPTADMIFTDGISEPCRRPPELVRDTAAIDRATRAGRGKPKSIEALLREARGVQEESDEIQLTEADKRQQKLEADDYYDVEAGGLDEEAEGGRRGGY